MTVARAGEIDDYVQTRLLTADAKIGNALLWGRNLQMNTRCIDVIAVGMVFFQGFAALDAGALDASPLLKQWLKGPETRERSARLVANLVATQLCAELDSYVPSLASFGREYSPEFAERYDRLKRDINSAKDLKRERSVDEVLRPSGQKWTKWPERAGQLFEVDLDPQATEGLRDLVGARQCAAHESHKNSYSGEHISMWFGCVRWLTDRAVASVDALVPFDAGQPWFGKM